MRQRVQCISFKNFIAFDDTFVGFEMIILKKKTFSVVFVCG